jgi:cytochrome c oxidase subunit II
MFDGASPYSDFIDGTFLSIFGLELLVMIGLMVATITFIIKYSRKRNPHPTNIEGSTVLEVTWTAVPLVLFMGMFYLGWEGYQMEITIPPDSMPITVNGRMWTWEFVYPNGVKTDTLFVPVNQPVSLTIRSLDVNHSFFVPAFRIKKDAIPTRENHMWFKTVKVTSYDIECAEYCGLNHSYMLTKVVSVDSTAFESWYQEQSVKQGKTYAHYRPE